MPQLFKRGSRGHWSFTQNSCGYENLPRRGPYSLPLEFSGRRVLVIGDSTAWNAVLSVMDISCNQHATECAGGFGLFHPLNAFKCKGKVECHHQAQTIMRKFLQFSHESPVAVVLALVKTLAGSFQQPQPLIPPPTGSLPRLDLSPE